MDNIGGDVAGRDDDRLQPWVDAGASALGGRPGQRGAAESSSRMP